jgi:hypothetical protein
LLFLAEIIYLTVRAEYPSRPVQADYFPFGFAAATGDGLAAGLAVVAGDADAGAAGVVLAGEGAVAGDDVAGEFEFEFELVAGSSAQPTAKAIARTAGSNNIVRLKSFAFELLIVYLVRAGLKNATIIARSLIRDNECSHRSCAGASAPFKLSALFWRCAGLGHWVVVLGLWT